MPDIRRFDNIVEAIGYLEPNHILADCFHHDGIALNYKRFDAVQMPDGRIAFICNTGNFCFYRGENRIYDSCKASLYRIEKRNDKIAALAKTYEFMEFLNTLPEVILYKENHFWYEPWALAQHYEFATPMIDLTNEIAVAAFFATHIYDPVIKGFVLAKEGVGQIRSVACIPGIEDSRLSVIGMQPFSRPGNQYGYGYWLPETEDFAKESGRVEFVQDYEANLTLERAMGGIASLYFPNEQIAQMAAVIKTTGVVTNKAIDVFIEDVKAGHSYIQPAVTRDEVVEVLKQAGVFIVDAPVICPQAIPHFANPIRREQKLVTHPAYKGYIK